MKKAKVVSMIPKSQMKTRLKATRDAKRVGSFGYLLKKAFKEQKGINI